MMIRAKLKKKKGKLVLEYTKKSAIVRYRLTGIVREKDKKGKVKEIFKRDIRDKYIDGKPIKGANLVNPKKGIRLNGKYEVVKEIWRIEYKKDKKGNLIVDWNNKWTKRLNFKYLRYSWPKRKMSLEEEMNYCRHYTNRLKWYVKQWKIIDGKLVYMSAS